MKTKGKLIALSAATLFSVIAVNTNADQSVSNSNAQEVVKTTTAAHNCKGNSCCHSKATKKSTSQTHSQ